MLSFIILWHVGWMEYIRPVRNPRPVVYKHLFLQGGSKVICQCLVTPIFNMRKSVCTMYVISVDRSWRKLCNHAVCLFVCLCVCLWAGLLLKVIGQFHWNQWEESFNFWWWSRIWIPDHFSVFLTIAESGVLRDSLAFLVQSSATCTKLASVTLICCYNFNCSVIGGLLMLHVLVRWTI